VHFWGGEDRPGPVDACPRGASPFGVLNMAGNVWEWLSDGWLIGGAWSFTELSDDYTEAVGDKLHKFYYLHDPLPTEAVYGKLSTAERNSYFSYRASSEETLQKTGLRCVIPLGRPRRQAP
jgi:formylglycine-generating enzyme required for sulfatase activity